MAWSGSLIAKLANFAGADDALYIPDAWPALRELGEDVLDYCKLVQGNTGSTSLAQLVEPVALACGFLPRFAELSNEDTRERGWTFIAPRQQLPALARTGKVALSVEIMQAFVLTYFDEKGFDFLAFRSVSRDGYGITTAFPSLKPVEFQFRHGLVRYLTRDGIDATKFGMASVAAPHEHDLMILLSRTSTEPIVAAVKGCTAFFLPEAMTQLLANLRKFYSLDHDGRNRWLLEAWYGSSGHEQDASCLFTACEVTLTALPMALVIHTGGWDCFY